MGERCAPPVAYVPQVDGAVIIRLTTEHGHCNLCVVHPDECVEWMANCPPIDATVLMGVLWTARELVRHG